MAYNWKYAYVGGVPRVKITTGDDIAHLGELDEKMWTVLSCPVRGLEIDERSLGYIDTNNDDFVHVTEVVTVAEWLTAALTNPDILVEGSDTVALSAFNAESEQGKALLEASQSILKALGKAEAEEISLADSSSYLAAVMEQKMAALKAEREAQEAVAAPFADRTDAVKEAYAALTPKVKDFFMRSRLAAFTEESTSALDVQVGQIEAISTANLTDHMADIAACPLARVKAHVGEPVLPLSSTVNPAWVAQWNEVRTCFKADITEAAWDELGARLKAHTDYVASLEVCEADVALDEETASIQIVDKFLHLLRDFYMLLQNFVTFANFYTPGESGIFQAGTLYIDQRACHLCMRVTDAAAMTAQAAASGLFLVFCHCTSKRKAQPIDIVAAVTVGDTQNITVGKNAIFYDRQGHDWDARVTNIMDNPISIRQAALSPYRKMMTFVEEKVRSMAQKKEDAVISKAAATVDEKAESAATATANAAAAPAAAQPDEYKAAARSAATAFDIAKFAGIFAAIGMAVGAVGTMFTALGTAFFRLAWWQQPLTILAIFLLISGPSMLLAWLKLRRRNISPLLNANG